MLTRFRKNGGFYQLLTLLESCDRDRQEQLLKLISMEDPGWARLAKLKLLTVARVLGWPERILGEIIPQIPYPIVVNLYLGLDAPARARFETSLPPEWRRKFQSDIEGAKPAEAERFAAGVTLLQTVRELAAQGLLRFSEFDPDLEVDSRLVA